MERADVSPGLATRFMSVEFVDTNILIYAHDGGAGTKHDLAEALLRRLADAQSGATSTQVLVEFYAAATRKLRIPSEEAEETIDYLAHWRLHRPNHDTILHAIRLERRHKISWWDALILASALELGCKTLWSEDFQDGRKFGSLTVRNPFA